MKGIFRAIGLLLVWPQLLIEHMKALERKGQETGFLLVPLVLGMVWMLGVMAGAVLLIIWAALLVLDLIRGVL